MGDDTIFVFEQRGQGDADRDLERREVDSRDEIQWLVGRLRGEMDQGGDLRFVESCGLRYGDSLRKIWFANPEGS